MNVLIYGDTERSPELRHEVPLTIIDPFLYMETDGRRAVLTNALEEARIAEAAPSIERLLGEKLGRDDLIAGGCSRAQVDQELCLRAVAALGIRSALVPPDFPLVLGDRLRAAGIELQPDEDAFVQRRRRKTPAEIDGIRRAADAAMRAMEEARRTLGEAEIRGGQLWLDGELLTSEALRARIRELCYRLGAPVPPDILVRPMGANPQIGHYAGWGPLPAHTPILIDLWPRHEESGCWADMTRTFVRGEIDDRVAELHALVLDAHERACAAVAPGVRGIELYEIVCDLFEAAGHPTQRTKRPGDTLREGFYASLGHGVGLEIHEPPILGRGGADQLIPGDVIAVEPGLVVPSLGGTRVEDLLLVTNDGAENLTATSPHGLDVWILQ